MPQKADLSRSSFQTWAKDQRDLQCVSALNYANVTQRYPGVSIRPLPLLRSPRRPRSRVGATTAGNGHTAMAAQYPPRYWEGKPAACLRPIHSTNQSPSKCHSYSGRQFEGVSPSTSTTKGKPKGFLKYLHLWQPEYERNLDTYI